MIVDCYVNRIMMLIYSNSFLDFDRISLVLYDQFYYKDCIGEDEVNAFPY